MKNLEKNIRKSLDKASNGDFLHLKIRQWDSHLEMLYDCDYIDKKEYENCHKILNEMKKN